MPAPRTSAPRDRAGTLRTVPQRKLGEFFAEPFNGYGSFCFKYLLQDILSKEASRKGRRGLSFGSKA
jgi:hypothetical protein